MTPAFFLLAFFISLWFAFSRNPMFGIYAYMLAFHMSPSYYWWGSSVPDLRYVQLAALAMIITAVNMPKDKDRPSLHSYWAGKIMLCFAGYFCLQYFWAESKTLHLAGTIMFLKHVVVFYLIYTIVNSTERIVQFLFAHIAGSFWFGYVALSKSGGRLENVGGPVGGSNELAQHVTTAILVGGVMWLILAGRKRLIVFLSMPFIVNTLVLASSRGAFLGLISGGLAGIFYMPPRYRGAYIGAGVLGVMLVIALAHNSLVERFQETYLALTTDEKQLDNSAASRTDIFKAGIQIGKDHPLGTGFSGTVILSPYYMDARWLSEDGGRSAHNTFAGIFAEHGYLGAALYLSLIFWGLTSAKRVVKTDNSLDDFEKALVVAVTAALVSMWTSGNSSENFLTETQYWLLSILCVLLSLAKKEKVQEL